MMAMFEDAMNRIRVATGVQEINEVILKFANQEETVDNLKEMK
jgi:hypothetical protein